METTETIDEIKHIGEQLAAIEAARHSLPASAHADRTRLLEEEHRLDIRLAELLTRATETIDEIARGEAARGTDLTRGPGLPDS